MSPTELARSDHARGYLIALCATAILSSIAVLIRYLSLAYHLPVLVMAFWRDVFVVLTLVTSGFRRRAQLSPQNPGMGIWALTVFRDGWQVMDCLGTTPEALVSYLMGRWRPGVWMEEADLLKIPSELRNHLKPNWLTFGPQDHPLDLHWLGGRLACGLTIAGPIPGLSLPKVMVCAGGIHIEQLHGLVTINNLSAPRWQLTLKACPDLESIALPESRSLAVQGCHRLTQIRGKVTGDITVEDCSELTNLDIVLPKDASSAPSIVVRRCAKLGSIGQASGVPRVCKDVVVEDCADFRGFWLRLIVRGERRITGCPHLTDNG